MRRELRTLRSLILRDLWRIREVIRGRFPFRVCSGCGDLHRVAATWTTVRRGRLARLPLCFECAVILMGEAETMLADSLDPSRKPRRRGAALPRGGTP